VPQSFFLIARAKGRWAQKQKFCLAKNKKSPTKYAMDAKTLRVAIETVLKLIGIPVVEPNIISAISKADENTESFDMKYLLQLVFKFYDKVRAHQRMPSSFTPVTLTIFSVL